MRVYSVEDINNVWSCERIIQLMDDARMAEAQAIAEEWGYSMDASVDFEGG